MTAGQYHFMEGFVVGLPPILQGHIEGDGALILTSPHEEDAVIVFTKGKLACRVIPAPKALMGYLKEIKDGPGEEM